MKDNDFLKHFGILGMKWGHKKLSENNIPHSQNKNASDESADHKQKKELTNKQVKTMSNADLKALTTRLLLEKQYKELSKKEVSPGKKFVTDILSTAAKTTATTYVTKYMGKSVEKIIEKASK